MARTDLLRQVIHQASRNGFQLQDWYIHWLNRPWSTEQEAVEHLATGRNYYSLFFSHAFAQAFWKHGTKVTFLVPNVSYTRRDKDGNVVQVNRRAFSRRRLKPDAWKYHLREMAESDEPLRYVRRFLSYVPDLEAAAATKPLRPKFAKPPAAPLKPARSG